MKNILNHDEWCITLLHYMLPVGLGKNCSRFHEVRQIICPLTKHRQNKQNFGKIFKVPAFEIDISYNGISCNCYAKINKRSWNKGE